MQRPLGTYFIYYLCHFTAVHHLRISHNKCGLLKSFSKICHCSSKNALDNGGQEKGAVCLMYPVIHLSQICCHNSILWSISIRNQRPFLKGAHFLSTQRSISLIIPLLRLLVTRAGSPSIGSKPRGSSSRATTGFLRTSSIWLVKRPIFHQTCIADFVYKFSWTDPPTVCF